MNYNVRNLYTILNKSQYENILIFSFLIQERKIQHGFNFLLVSRLEKYSFFELFYHKKNKNAVRLKLEKLLLI